MGISFGDLIPDGFKSLFTSSFPKLGEVICFHDDRVEPAKIKMSVIVGCTQTQIATVFINSAINPNLFQTPASRALHYQILQANNNFLKWDSFVDCSELYELDLQEIKSKIGGQLSIRCGELNPAEFEIVQNLIRTSKTITPKKLIKYSLK